jgi:FkbM family methyltransferase
MVTSLGVAVLLITLVLLAAFNRNALSRALHRARAAQAAPAAPPAEVSMEPEDRPRPNCGLPSLTTTAERDCMDEQRKHYEASKDSYWGSAGYDRTKGTLFNRFDGRAFFPRSRPILMVSVGAHFGDIIDKYGALGRGPRLDDRIVLVEPHPLTVKRLSGRIRLDHRLMLMPAAAADFDGRGWFEFSNGKAESGGSGRLKRELPENTTRAEAEGKGAEVRVVTLDSLLKKFEGPIDFIFMDADTHEPMILKGMQETLKRTRMVIFSCHSKWKSMGGELGSVADAVRDVFTPAGMAVALLGEKRNLLLGADVMPPELWDKLPDWGFCMATHVAPPITRKSDEHARMMAGPDAFGGVCGKVFENLAAGHCKAGVLDTLYGLDAPAPSPNHAPAYY